ncbi:MAG: ATP-binding cassette domain-containing protein, partial [Acidimicrobiia bacterium]|nr:ATP-binding cassette domain-containing protein [Acidimicrobiia bacterium]
SGGQRQRIALARALLAEPTLLILDEATSAVDQIAESTVRDALRENQGRFSMLVIAHRLETIQDVDRVLVIDDGRLIEQGSPEELLQSDSLFARLHGG